MEIVRRHLSGIVLVAVIAAVVGWAVWATVWPL